MAREILFKAKRTDNGEWVEGSLIIGVFCRLGQDIPYILCPNEVDYDCFEDFSEENGIFEVQPDTICQYTGLTDKNGNKIWENDIVSFTHSKLKDINCDNAFGIPNFQTVKYKRNYVIEFVDTFCTYGLRFRNGSIHFPCKHSTCRMHDVEVIGNIFDNPELLKEE